MKVLAIDTSSPVGSLAITGAGAVVTRSLTTLPGHSESLLYTIREMLDSTGLAPADIELLAAGVGPGSFTGLRVGLAAMKGLHLSLGRPLLGAPSLLALAMNAMDPAPGGLPHIGGETVCAASDARRGDIFTAVFAFDGRSVAGIVGEQMTRPETLVAQLESLGRRVVCVGDAFLPRTGGAMIGRRDFMQIPEGTAVHYPSAVNVAAIALNRLELGEHDDAGALEPRYVRPVDYQKS